MYYKLFMFKMYFSGLGAILIMFFNCSCVSFSSINVCYPFNALQLCCLKDYFGFTTCDHLYVLLEDKEQVLNDVVGMLILIMHDKLVINPTAHPKCGTVTRPLVPQSRRCSSSMIKP